MLPFLTHPHDTVNSDSKWEIREHSSMASPLTCLVSVAVPRTFKIYFNKKVVPSFTIYVINTASTSSYPDPLCQFLFYSVYTLLISSLCLFPLVAVVRWSQKCSGVDAHQCAASDRSRQHEKRGCWNKYICNEAKGASKWVANLCLSNAERGSHWRIDL